MDKLTEPELEEILCKHPEYVEAGLKLVCQQYKTAAGIIDMLCKDISGNFVIVEVKVEATFEVIGQIGKYILSFAKENPGKKIRAILAAKSIPETVQELCFLFKIEPVIINKNSASPLFPFQDINERLKRIEKQLEIIENALILSKEVKIKKPQKLGKGYNFNKRYANCGMSMMRILTFLSSEQTLELINEEIKEEDEYFY